MARAVELHAALIPPELRTEIEGIAAGLTAAGVPSTFDDVLGINDWMELTGYWWPKNSGRYTALAPTGGEGNHCSAFIATGSATADGSIVLGHTSFTGFWQGQFENVILDITPDDGNRMVMQTAPGWIMSMTDFWLSSVPGRRHHRDHHRWLRRVQGVRRDTDAGVLPRPRCNAIRQRHRPLDQPHERRQQRRIRQLLVDRRRQDRRDRALRRGLAVPKPQPHDRWLLLGRQPTRGSADSQPGVLRDRVQRRYPAPNGARQVRWQHLLGDFDGRIDVEVGKRMLADTFDPYLNYTRPSSRTICAHSDEDPCENSGLTPFTPFGSIDAKVACRQGHRRHEPVGALRGRADGAPFDADEFLRQHPQWNWQQGYLQSRPQRPWVYVDSPQHADG